MKIYWPNTGSWKVVASWHKGNYPRKPRPGQVVLADDDGNYYLYQLAGKGALAEWKTSTECHFDSDIHGRAVIEGTYPNFYIEREPWEFEEEE